MPFALRAIGEADLASLSAWLPQQTFPFHGRPRVDAAWVGERAASGYFFGADARSFWVLEQGAALAVVRVYSLGDVTPEVDLRVGNAARGRGVGTFALRALAEFTFTAFPQLERLGGYTRFDNLAMRRVFVKCSFVQEAHHRRAWRVEGGSAVDTVGYGLLRSDFEAGTVTPIAWG